MTRRPTILVTGSSGLIGSEVCIHFDKQGWCVHGVDNNQRAAFFGPAGDTRWSQQYLESTLKHFQHHEMDVRDRQSLLDLIPRIQPDAVVHAAAQPSHDRATLIPFDDFDVNAVGTFNLLEAVRRYRSDIPFVHMSTNKVYGDAPNKIALKETPSRYEFDDDAYRHGIPETLSIDQNMHSLFGASKASADLCVQEYGRYFEMPTCVLRGGCLTGSMHAGVELHGFLSYLVQCNLKANPYTVYGYDGKQVRDNLDAYDVATFIELFVSTPRVAEVYNIGGGITNTCSILEAFDMVESLSGKKMIHTYEPTPRRGDHKCYYSDLRKMKSHYPSWQITKALPQIFEEIFTGLSQRIGTA